MEKEDDMLSRIEELEGQLAYECECNKQFVECQNKCEQLEKENKDIRKETAREILQTIQSYQEEDYLQDLIDIIAKEYGVDLEVEE